MGERRILYLVGLVGSLVFYWAYREWLSWVILMSVVWVPWLSLLVSLPAMLKLRLRVHCPAYVQQDEEVRASLTGQCPLPAPQTKGRLRVTVTRNGKTEKLKNYMSLPTDHCSEVTVEPMRAWVYDYLGLFRWPVRLKEKHSMLVRPKPVAMENPPDLQRYLSSSWKPKPGGGFAENHELRLYRPGDNLNQVHWKLSAKTGKLVLREPMEPLRGLAMVTMVLCGTDRELDEKLGRLLWLSRYLTQKDVPHEIRCLTGSGMQVFRVENAEDSQRAVDGILRCPACTENADVYFGEASWHHHIGGGGDEA